MSARPQAPRARLLLLNSAVAFAVALMITISVHEFGHAVAARGLGLQPTLYANRVEYGSASAEQQLIIALAGPIVS